MDPLRGQRLCLSPFHRLDNVFINPVGSLLLCSGAKRGGKNAFPNDAILNDLEPANGLVSEPFSEFSPQGKGHSCD